MLYHDISMASFHTRLGSISVRVMGVVVVLLKLIYRLDDNYEQYVSVCMYNINYRKSRYFLISEYLISHSEN